MPRSIAFPRPQLNRLGYSNVSSLSLNGLAEYLVGTKEATEVYPLVDMFTGTTILAYIDANLNGTSSNWTLQSEVSPVPEDVGLAPLLPGAANAGNILSAPFQAKFNGKIGSAWILMNLDDSDWGVGIDRLGTRLLGANTQNFMQMQKTASGALRWAARWQGGVTQTREKAIQPAGWFSMGMSWKDGSSGNEFIAYYNGVQEGATMIPGTSWSGSATTLTLALIGASAVAGNASFKGSLCYASYRFGSIWSPTDFSDIHNRAFNGA